MTPSQSCRRLRLLPHGERRGHRADSPTVTDASRTTTPRLLLTRPGPGDLDEVHALLADPLVWEHFPQLRHADVATTEEVLARQQRQWDADGLSTWVARAATGEDAGRLLGVGGCSVRDGVVWNLSYRFHRHAWGHGYAQELIAAARAAATRRRPDLPVTAYLLEHNTGSRRAAERAGLRLVWRGPDQGNPDPDAVRLVYADRDLTPPTLASLTGHA